MATDPYAAIRALASNAILHDPGDATPFMYEHGDGLSNAYTAATRPEGWGLNRDVIGPYQSKHNNVTRNPDGTFTVQFQNPGRDKYQLLEANYKLGDDGSYQMIGDPREFEQESSMSNAIKGIGAGAGFLAGGYGLANGLGLGAAAGAGSGATGAVSAGTAAELGALNGGMMGTGTAGAAAGGASAAELAAIDAAMGGGLGGTTAPGGLLSGNAGWLEAMGGVTPTGGDAGVLEAMGGAGSGGSSATGGLGGTTYPGYSAAGNYGPGMTGAQTSAYDGVLGLTGSPGAANVAGNLAGIPSGLLDMLPPGVTDAAGGIWEWIKKNPRIVGALAGGLLGGSEGGGDSGPAPYTGPMPTITRGGWQADARGSYKPMAQPNYGLLSPQVRPGANSGIGRYSGLLGG